MTDLSGIFAPIPKANSYQQFTAANEEDTEWHIVQPIPACALSNIPKHKLGAPSYRWDYNDKDGQMLFMVFRFDPPAGRKQIRPLTLWQHRDGRQEWRWESMPIPRPLYNLYALVTNPGMTVVVCEGEKTADAIARDIDCVAITCANGAKAAKHADWSRLKGRKVFVFPDNDAEGKAYAADVVRLAHAAGALSVKVVQIPEHFPPKWDYADGLPEGVTRDDIYQLFQDAQLMPKDTTSSNAKRRSGYNADELQHMEFPPVRYVVAGYIPEGLTIFSGRPKLGKSWACMDIAIAVARGGLAFTSIPCEQGDVLYMALEDNPRRLKSRLSKLLGKDCIWPTALFFETQSPCLNEGGLEMIRQWIESKANPRLIIIDTLGKIRGDAGKQDSAYQADYKVMAELQTLAGEKDGLAIVMVHHVRKMEAADPIDTVSGTLGLSGAADTILVLNRNAQGVTLYGRGRDIEEIETVMKFDKSAYVWKIVGDAGDVKKSDERSEIMAVLDEVMRPMSPHQVAQVLGKKSDAVRQMLVRMAATGDIQKIGRGQYASITYAENDCSDVDACHNGHTVTDEGDGVGDCDTVTSVTGDLASASKGKNKKKTQTKKEP